jgi:hypothetical protein
MGKLTSQMRKLLLLIGIFITGFTSAQVTLQPKQMESNDVGVIYDEEFAINFYLHTRGYGFGAIFGQIKTYYKTSFYHVDFGMVKHPKENRPDNQLNQFNVLSRPYVYGKKNSFFVLRAGKGAKRYLSEKAKRKGIAMGYSYQLGPSIGMLKPYYLDLRTEPAGAPPQLQVVKYSEESRELFLDPGSIDGYSGFWKGVGETSFIFGGHVKLGAHFAWGAYEKGVKALEVGLMIDAFFQKVDILAIEDNSPVFANLYLNLQLGRRK